MSLNFDGCFGSLSGWKQCPTHRVAGVLRTVITYEAACLPENTHGQLRARWRISDYCGTPKTCTVTHVQRRVRTHAYDALRLRVDLEEGNQIKILVS